jgi:hypothetical protein
VGKLPEASKMVANRKAIKFLEQLSKDIASGKVPVDTKGHFKDKDWAGDTNWVREYLSAEHSFVMTIIKFSKEEDINKLLQEGIEHWSSLDCEKCGERVSFSLVDNGTKLEASGKRCAYEKGHPEIVTKINVPSGVLVMYNDLRRVMGDDRKCHDFNINSTAGIRQYSEWYAKKGMAMHFLSNTSPDVWQPSEDRLLIGKPTKKEGKKVVGNICTDLWWYCAIDKDLFEKKARMTIDDFNKAEEKRGAWTRLVIVNVKPGVYKTIGRYHLVNDEKRNYVYSELVWDSPIEVFKLKAEKGVRYNGGQKCDMAVGPCSCGAWH